MPKILIVDAGEQTRDSLASQLQSQGFDVVVGTSGKVAPAMVLSEKPDLVLMDMNLPEMDGWEAIRQIKAEPAGESLPVIALTEQAKPGDRDQAAEISSAHCYCKPVDFPNLLGQIEKLLKNRSALENPLLS